MVLTPPSPLRVLVFDPSARFTDELREILDGGCSTRLVGWTDDAESALELARSADVAIVATNDLGAETAQRLIELDDGPRVVVVGGAAVEAHGFGLIDGAAGFVRMDEPTPQMLRLIVAVVALTALEPEGSDHSGEN